MRELTRREFVASSCAAWITRLAAASPAAARQIWRTNNQAKVVIEEPWARIEELADGVWAVVSTPLKDRKTTSNGAIIRGKNRVLVVEAFGSNDGARWLSEWARKLTGRPVDDVIVTHFHADHTGGIGGYGAEGEHAGLRATSTTVELTLQDDVKRNRAPESPRTRLLSGAQPIQVDKAGKIDLGGRTVNVVPRGGHTPSDVTIELDDPHIIIAGDLFWQRMFPNYVDARPSELSRSAAALEKKAAKIYVPGHGAVANHDDFKVYIEVLNAVEAAARHAHERGTPAAEAAKTFMLPASLGEWYMFSPRYYEVAIGAWERELKGS